MDSKTISAKALLDHIEKILEEEDKAEKAKNN